MATAAWLAASQNAATEPAFLLSIYDGTNTFRCLSRSCTSLTDPVAITNIDSVASEIDPLTRATSVGECVVDVLDAWARPIVANYRLRGQKATITYGFADIAEGDFDGFFVGEIANVEPIDGVTVRLTIRNALAILDDAEIWGAWSNVHPCEMLYAGAGTTTGVLTKAGIPDAMINAASFDRDVFNGTWRAPLSVYRAASTGSSLGGKWSEPIKAKELVDDACNILRCSLVPDANGVIFLVKGDPEASSVDDWTADDLIPGTLHQVETDGNAINRVIARHGIGPTGDLSHVYQDDDTTSQAALKFPGATERVLEYEFETQLVNGASTFPGTSLTVGATSMEIKSIFGMPGVAGQYPTPDANYYVSATGKGYVIVGKQGDNSNDELIECTAQTLTDETVTHNVGQEPGSAPESAVTFATCTYTVARGAGAKAHTSDEHVRDVTALYGAANHILAQFKYGAPVVELETPMHKAWVALASTVTITDPSILAYGINGATTSHKWEVVKKEMKPFASPPSIGWRLVYRDISATAGTRWIGAAQTAPDQMYGQNDSAADEFVSRVYVVSGYTITVTSGRTASIAAGVASVGTTKVRLGTAYSRTFAASKDTYVALGSANGGLAFYAVANGAAIPAKGRKETWLAKVVTNATDITSITDLRTLQSTDLDKVGDGATWKKVGGVDASNKASSSSIGAGAVGVHQSAGFDKRKSSSRNSSFQQWTRG